jgi:hypothetical protein
MHSVSLEGGTSPRRADDIVAAQGFITPPVLQCLFLLQEIFCNYTYCMSKICDGQTGVLDIRQ